MTNKWHLFEAPAYRVRMFDREYIKRGGEITNPTKVYTRVKYLGGNKWISGVIASKHYRNTCHLPRNTEKSSEELFESLVSPALGPIVPLDQLKKVVIKEGDNKLLELIDQSLLKTEEHKWRRIEKNRNLGITPIECDFKNQFECLCKLASDEHWCWKLHCTTCGHMHFRYAFVLMAKGTKIQDKVTTKRTEEGLKIKGWSVRSARRNFSHGLGVLPREYGPIQKDGIAKVCAKADLEIIANNCKYPDWRGYLGLVAAHMNSDSNAYKELSVNWAKQLLKMGEGEASRVELQKVANGERVLSWRDV